MKIEWPKSVIEKVAYRCELGQMNVEEVLTAAFDEMERLGIADYHPSKDNGWTHPVIIIRLPKEPTI